MLRLFSALLALSLSACVNYSNGVADKPIANDERLIGYWTAAEEPTLSLAIAADGPAGVPITLYKDQSCEKAMHLAAVRTSIDERDFLDITLIDDKGSSNVGPYNYEFRSPTQLTVFAPDLDSITRAVVAKELPGKTSKFPNTDQINFTEVDASTAELRQWVAAHPTAMRAKTIALIRQDPASAPRCG